MLALATACSSGGGDDASPEPGAPTSTTAAAPATTQAPPTVPGAGPLRDLPPPPEVLEVVYRVERPATGVVDTEQRLVRAPFEVRIETHRTEPAEADLDAEPTLLDVAVLGGAETGPADQDRALVVVPPRPALRGAHLGTDLAGAEAAGVVVPLDSTREVAGRRCTDLRTGAPLDGGILRAPSEDEHNDVCVGDDGIVLREEITAGGEVIERRTAVSVDEDPDLAADALDDAFTPLGHRIPDAEGGGRVRRVTPDSRPPGVPHLQLPAPPAGMDHLGRFGVLTDGSPGPNAAGQVGQVISMVDLYVGGGEVVSVENGAAVAGGPVLGRGDVPVPLPFAPEATAVFLTTGLEIRAPMADGRFVRITTTLPLDEAAALAATLVTVDGPGAVVPLDDQEDVTGRLEPPA